MKMPDVAAGVLAPSILSADFSKLYEEVTEVEQCGVNWLHVDVMDGHFVPNITIGPVVVDSLRKRTKSFLDCHLMVTNPEKWVESFLKAGADLITFHVETKIDHMKLIREIRSSKRECGVGMSVSPDTSVSALEPYLGEIDLVLVMSVHPGFGGQKFIEDSLAKVEALCDLRRERRYEFAIQIDGGINRDTCSRARRAGCDVFVAGSSVFSRADRRGAVAELQKSMVGVKSDQN